MEVNSQICFSFIFCFGRCVCFWWTDRCDHDLLLFSDIEEDSCHGKELPNWERGIPEGSREMQEEVKRIYRRETLRSYHTPSGVRLSSSPRVATLKEIISS